MGRLFSKVFRKKLKRYEIKFKAIVKTQDRDRARKVATQIMYEDFGKELNDQIVEIKIEAITYLMKE